MQLSGVSERLLLLMYHILELSGICVGNLLKNVKENFNGALCMHITDILKYGKRSIGVEEITDVDVVPVC
jgi:hypothetical protein